MSPGPNRLDILGPTVHLVREFRLEFCFSKTLYTGGLASRAQIEMTGGWLVLEVLQRCDVRRVGTGAIPQNESMSLISKLERVRHNGETTDRG